MIYIDSSVALARLLLEPRSASDQLWAERLVSSQLLEYEVWNRVHAYGVAHSVGNEAQALLLRVGMVEMTRSVLAKALEPLPVPLRTLELAALGDNGFSAQPRCNGGIGELR